jgi:hypothetical protein
MMMIKRPHKCIQRIRNQGDAPVTIADSAPPFVDR